LEASKTTPIGTTGTRAQPQYQLRELGRVGKYIVKRPGVITSTEFINKAFSEFADAGQVYPDVISNIWAQIPLDMQPEFVNAVHNAARPDFLFREVFIGPWPPRSEEERQRENQLRTEVVRAWAIEFERWLGDGKGQAT
jgi:hypothetical protein